MAFVGRDEECALLEGALTGVVAGVPAVVLVEGPPGCGKTDLLGELAARARRRGACVVGAVAGQGDERLRTDVVGQLTAALRAASPGGAPQRGLVGAVQAAAARRPLVLCVDDLHTADRSSLAELSALAGVLREVPVLLAVSMTPGDAGDDPVTSTELLRHPGFVRIRAARLTEAATAALFALTTGRPAENRLAGELYRLTGGSPLLVKALLSECPPPVDGAGEWAEPAAWGPFARAALTCLRRSGPAARTAALAMAALGEDATPGRLAALLDVAPSAVRRRTAAPAACGITDGCRVRHPGLAQVVLDAAEPRELAALYRRTARVLHRTGGTAATVVRHLLSAGAADGDGWAGPVRDGWAVPVLREAAGRFLVGDDSERAADCLRLAATLSEDDATRWETALQLAAVTWRTDPAAAERQLAGPLAALREGRLSGTAAGELARLLVAQGRVEEGAESLGYLEPRGAAAPEVPGRRENPLRGLHALALAPAETTATLLHTSSALWTHPVGDSAGHAEEILQHTPLTPLTFDPLVQAVRTLVHTAHPEAAAVRCGKLRAEAARLEAPGWEAVFGLLHAETLLRLGELAGAEREAASVSAVLGGRGGLLLFAPAALRSMALTEMGRYEEAARCLEPPFAGGLFSSVHALAQLRARGHYYRATCRHDAALGEFLHAGRLARRWGLDRPQQVPWRTDAAQALLALGDVRRAEKLVVEQLALPDSRNPRVRGVSLRLRAATVELNRRPKLLAQAADELRRSGDRLELARALADLGRSLQMTGEGGRAGALTRRAWLLAAECGAAPLCESILPGQSPVAEPPRPRQEREAAPAQADLLSEAERRVASLAAYGYTNREISARLYVATSTVEQHLTRAYRKLHITRRQDLPLGLEFGDHPGTGDAIAADRPPVLSEQEPRVLSEQEPREGVLSVPPRP